MVFVPSPQVCESTRLFTSGSSAEKEGAPGSEGEEARTNFTRKVPTTVVAGIASTNPIEATRVRTISSAIWETVSSSKKGRCDNIAKIKVGNAVPT